MRLILLLLFMPILSLSQPIDKINTIEKAEDFIKDNVKFKNLKYREFIISSPDSSEYDNYKFGDFNHDGFLDLLVYGTAYFKYKMSELERDEIIILLGGKKRFRKANFSYRFFWQFSSTIFPYPKLIKIDGKDYIQIKYDIHDYRNRTKETFTDTVFVKYDRLIQYKDNPDINEISRISFKTDHCYGSCPVFEVDIYSNREVDYNGIDYVNKKGYHKLMIDKIDWDYMETLISFLKVNELNNEYNVNWTDSQTGYLTVYYKDGGKKQIQDYGLAGTFGLAILYDYLFEFNDF